MAEPRTLRCATESLGRGEPLVGTASRVQRWMVVEQPGAWGREAVVESELDRAVAAALQESARRHRVRLLLARRPGDRRRDGDRRVMLAHSGRESYWIEELDLPRDAPEALLDIDLGALAFPEAPGIGRPGPPGVYLVCTNGKHDPCCADLGRPVTRALVAAQVPDVWESSHVGGDRFAANVVCLPDGVYYGRVAPADAARLLTEHRDGTVDLEHYRGRSCLQPVVQAADLYARRKLDERRRDGLILVSSEAGADDTIAVVMQQRGGVTVEVVVRRERAAVAAQLTCHVPEPSRPWTYRLVEVRVA